MAGSKLALDPATDISFLYSRSLPFHPNAMTFMASFHDGQQIAETWYSIGGGFVKKEGEESGGSTSAQLPFPINIADDLLHWCRKTGMSIHEIVMENEAVVAPETATRKGVLDICRSCGSVTYRGCHSEGMLPGGLNVKRRAAALNKEADRRETI